MAYRLGISEQEVKGILSHNLGFVFLLTLAMRIKTGCLMESFAYSLCAIVIFCFSLYGDLNAVLYTPYLKIFFLQRERMVSVHRSPDNKVKSAPTVVS